MSIPQALLRDEIPRDEGNPPKADKRSRWAFSDSLNIKFKGA
jgi:hypothetical protein